MRKVQFSNVIQLEICGCLILYADNTYCLCYIFVLYELWNLWSLHEPPCFKSVIGERVVPTSTAKMQWVERKSNVKRALFQAGKSGDGRLSPIMITLNPFTESLLYKFIKGMWVLDKWASWLPSVLFLFLLFSKPLLSKVYWIAGCEHLIDLGSARAEIQRT